MTSTTLSTDSVYEEEKCLVKSGKDTQQAGQKKEYRLLGKVSLDTCPFILGYIAKYPRILFGGNL